MRHLILILLMLTAGAITLRAQSKARTMPFKVMEYNCENLFDCEKDSGKYDNEFLPDSERKWIFPKYWHKINNIGRVIHQCGGERGNRHMPDIIALIEVENDSTMVMLTRRSMLRAAGYKYIITQSPDPRGVDVALLYNPLTFGIITHYPLRVTPPRHESPTRDILYVKGRTRTNDTLHVFVVHAPSRNGGQKPTERYRMTVASRLIRSLDSLRLTNPQANIIVAGDFNDYHYNKSLKMLYANGLNEISRNATGRIAKGTYKYNGWWGNLDHILISHAMQQYYIRCWIHDRRWMLESGNDGYKPRRSFQGPFYKGGPSDHLPLVVTFEMPYTPDPYGEY